MQRNAYKRLLNREKANYDLGVGLEFKFQTERAWKCEFKLTD